MPIVNNSAVAPVSFLSGYGRFESKFLCVEHSNGDMSFVNPDCVVGRVYWAAFHAEKKTMKIAYLLEKESQYVEMHGPNAAAMAAHFRALSTVMMTDEKRAAFVAGLEKAMAESPPTTAEFLAESGIRIAPASPEEAAALATGAPSLLGRTPPRVDYRHLVDRVIEAYDAPSEGPGGSGVRVEWLQNLGRRINAIRALREMDKP